MVSICSGASAPFAVRRELRLLQRGSISCAQRAVWPEPRRPARDAVTAAAARRAAPAAAAATPLPPTHPLAAAACAALAAAAVALLGAAPPAAAAAAGGGGLVQYANGVQGYRMEVPPEWDRKDKAGADVLFEDPGHR
jgi:hypothetical protein